MSETLQNAASPEVDQLFERTLLDLGIPPCPLLLDRFINEMNKEEPDYNRLAQIISSDVSLAASLIKTANSPFFGPRRHVRSVNEALTILGLKNASRAVAGIILRKSFPNVPNLERFWDASSRIALLSGWLAQHLDSKDLHAEDAYTFGLFRDCGIPVLLGRFPNYRNTLGEANHETIESFTTIEERALPTNHAMVGCLLAQNWWLPQEICLAIRNHHDLMILESAHSAMPMTSRKLVAAAQLAEHLIQKTSGLSTTQEWAKLGAACLRLLDIEEAQLDPLYAAVACALETME